MKIEEEEYLFLMAQRKGRAEDVGRVIEDGQKL